METNITDQIVNEMLKNGSFYKAQSAAVASVGKEIAKSDISEAKSYKKPKDSLANSIANEIVFQFLEQHNFTNTIDCGGAESEGNFAKKHGAGWAGENLELNGSKNLVKQLFEEHEIPDTTVPTTSNLPEITDIIQQILIPSKRLPRPPSDSDDEYSGDDETLETTITNFDLNPHQKRALEEMFLRETKQLELKRLRREERAAAKEQRRKEHEERVRQRELQHEPTLSITEESISSSPELVDEIVMHGKSRINPDNADYYYSLDSNQRTHPTTIYVEEEEEVYEEEDVIDEMLRTDSINSSELIMTNFSSADFTGAPRSNLVNGGEETPLLSNDMTGNSTDQQRTEGSAYPGSTTNTTSHYTVTRTRSSATKSSSRTGSNTVSKSSQPVPTMDSTYPGATHFTGEENNSSYYSGSSGNYSSYGSYGSSSIQSSNVPSQYPGSTATKSTPGISGTGMDNFTTTATKIRSSATGSRTSKYSSSKQPTMESTYPGNLSDTNTDENSRQSTDGSIENGYPENSTSQKSYSGSYSTSNYSYSTNTDESLDNKSSRFTARNQQPLVSGDQNSYSTNSTYDSNQNSYSTEDSNEKGSDLYNAGALFNYKQADKKSHISGISNGSSGGSVDTNSDERKPMTAGELGSLEDGTDSYTYSTQPETVTLDDALLPGVSQNLKMREATSHITSYGSKSYSTATYGSETDFTYQTVSLTPDGDIPSQFKNRMVKTVSNSVIDSEGDIKGTSSGGSIDSSNMSNSSGEMKPISSLGSQVVTQGSTTYSTRPLTKLEEAFLRKPESSNTGSSGGSIDTTDDFSTDDVTYETITVDQNGRVITNASASNFRKKAPNSSGSYIDTNDVTSYTYDTITVDENGVPVRREGVNAVTPLITEYMPQPSVQRDEDGNIIDEKGKILRPAEALLTNDVSVSQTGDGESTYSDIDNMESVEGSNIKKLTKRQKHMEHQNNKGALYAAVTRKANVNDSSEYEYSESETEGESYTYDTITVDENGLPVSKFSKELQELAKKQQEEIKKQQEDLVSENVPDWAKGVVKDAKNDSELSIDTDSTSEYTYETITVDQETNKPIIQDPRLRDELQKYINKSQTYSSYTSQESGTTTQNNGKSPTKDTERLHKPSPQELERVINKSSNIDSEPSSEEYTYMSVSEDQIPALKDQLASMTGASQSPNKFAEGKRIVGTQEIESISIDSQTYTTDTKDKASRKRTRRRNNQSNTTYSSYSRTPVGRPLTALEQAFAKQTNIESSGEYDSTQSGEYTDVTVTLTLDENGNPIIPLETRLALEKEENAEKQRQKKYQREYPNRSTQSVKPGDTTLDESTDEPVSEWGAMTKPYNDQKRKGRGNSRADLLAQFTGSTEKGSGVNEPEKVNNAKNWKQMVKGTDIDTADYSNSQEYSTGESENDYTYRTATAGTLLLDKVKREMEEENNTTKNISRYAQDSESDSNIDTVTIDSYITQDDNRNKKAQSPKKRTSLVDAYNNKTNNQTYSGDYSESSYTYETITVDNKNLNRFRKQPTLETDFSTLEPTVSTTQLQRNEPYSPSDIERMQRYRVPSNNPMGPKSPKKLSDWEQMNENQEKSGEYSSEFETVSELPTDEMTDFEKMMRQKQVTEGPPKFSVPANNYGEENRFIKTEEVSSEIDTASETDYTYKTVTIDDSAAKALYIPTRSNNNRNDDDEELSTWERYKALGDKQANEGESSGNDVYNPNAKVASRGYEYGQDEFKKMMKDGQIDVPASSVTNPTPASIEDYVRARRQKEEELKRKIADRRSKMPQVSGDETIDSESDASVDKNNKLLVAMKRRQMDSEQPSLDLSYGSESEKDDSQYVDDVIVNIGSDGVMIRTTPQGQPVDQKQEKKLPRYTDADLGKNHYPTRRGKYGKELKDEDFASAWDKMKANKIDSEQSYDDEKEPVHYDRRLAPPKGEPDETYTYESISVDDQQRSPKRKQVSDTISQDSYEELSVSYEPIAVEHRKRPEPLPKSRFAKEESDSYIDTISSTQDGEENRFIAKPTGGKTTLQSVFQKGKQESPKKEEYSEYSYGDYSYSTAPFEEIDMNNVSGAFLERPNDEVSSRFTQKSEETQGSKRTKSQALTKAIFGDAAAKKSEEYYDTESSTLESADPSMDSADVGFAPPKENPYQRKEKNVMEAEFTSDSIYKDDESEEKAQKQQPKENKNQTKESGIPSRYLQEKRNPFQPLKPLVSSDETTDSEQGYSINTDLYNKEGDKNFKELKNKQESRLQQDETYSYYSGEYTNDEEPKGITPIPDRYNETIPQQFMPPPSSRFEKSNGNNENSDSELIDSEYSTEENSPNRRNNRTRRDEPEVVVPSRTTPNPYDVGADNGIQNDEQYSSNNNRNEPRSFGEPKLARNPYDQKRKPQNQQNGFENIKPQTAQNNKPEEKKYGDDNTFTFDSQGYQQRRGNANENQPHRERRSRRQPQQQSGYVEAANDSITLDYSQESEESIANKFLGPNFYEKRMPQNKEHMNASKEPTPLQKAFNNKEKQPDESEPIAFNEAPESGDSFYSRHRPSRRQGSNNRERPSRRQNTEEHEEPKVSRRERHDMRRIRPEAFNEIKPVKQPLSKKFVPYNSNELSGTYEYNGSENNYSVLDSLKGDDIYDNRPKNPTEMRKETVNPYDRRPQEDKGDQNASQVSANRTRQRQSRRQRTSKNSIFESSDMNIDSATFDEHSNTFQDNASEQRSRTRTRQRANRLDRADRAEIMNPMPPVKQQVYQKPKPFVPTNRTMNSDDSGDYNTDSNTFEEQTASPKPAQKSAKLLFFNKPAQESEKETQESQTAQERDISQGDEEQQYSKEYSQEEMQMKLPPYDREKLAEKYQMEKPAARTRSRRQQTGDSFSSSVFEDIPSREQLFPSIQQEKNPSKFAAKRADSGTFSNIDSPSAYSYEPSEKNAEPIEEEEEEYEEEAKEIAEEEEEEKELQAPQSTTSYTYQTISNTYTYDDDEGEDLMAKLMPNRAKKAEPEQEYVYSIPAQPPIGWKPPQQEKSRFATGFKKQQSSESTVIGTGSSDNYDDIFSVHGSTGGSTHESVTMKINASRPLPEDPLAPIPYKKV